MHGENCIFPLDKTVFNPCPLNGLITGVESLQQMLFFSFYDTEGAIQSCNATAYVMSAALSPGALIALLVCMLILIGKQMHVHMYVWMDV